MSKSQAHVSNKVMGFNLSGVRVPLNVQILLHKRAGNTKPIFFRESNEMCIHISSSSIKLSFRGDFLKLLDLQTESVCKVSEFFSYS